MYPPAKSTSIPSSGVGFGRILTGAVSVGVLAFGAVCEASNSTDGASGGRDASMGRVVLMVVLAGRGDGVEGWIMEAARSFGRTTG